MNCAATIAKSLGGIRNGQGWLCRCPAHKDVTPSLSLIDGPSGLIVHCFAGCDWKAVKDALKGMGLSDDKWRPQAHPAHPQPKFDPHDPRKQEFARQVWQVSRPIAGTLGESYLQGRGIAHALPATLRFHPRLKHSENLYFPAVVSAVMCWPDKEVIAIHRTYLDPDGNGKAKMEPVKKMLGSCAGGAVRLALEGETLAIAEGIETALSVMQATGLPTWAALSTSGMTGLILPPLPLAGRVIICADNDPAGLAAADKAAIRFTQEGRSVRMAVPNATGADFNDVLNGKTYTQIRRETHVAA